MKIQIVYELSYDKNNLFYNLRVDDKLISSHTAKESAEKAFDDFIALNSKEHKPEIIKEVEI
jgi:hypothetical protein